LHFSILMTTAGAFAAIENGDLGSLTASLDAGTDPNASDGDGATLLMRAVNFDRLHMVDVLLSRGANVHLKDPHGRMALHFAAYYCGNDVFGRIFSAAGPRAMNFKDCFGWTPLHYLDTPGSGEQMAFTLFHPGIDVSILGLDVSMWNCGQQTPLDVPSHFCFCTALQMYGDQEARWQPERYVWIKLLMVPPTRQ
jgi:ankyrin repeat protein